MRNYPILSMMMISNIVLYILISFIVWDANPFNWLIFYGIWGRVGFVVIEAIIVGWVVEFF